MPGTATACRPVVKPEELVACPVPPEFMYASAVACANADGAAHAIPTIIANEKIAIFFMMIRPFRLSRS